MLEIGSHYNYQYSRCMLIRACVRSQGKGSYKHKALISSGSYLLNEEKGAKKKALISIQALIKVGSYKHTTTV